MARNYISDPRDRAANKARKPGREEAPAAEQLALAAYLERASRCRRNM